MDKEINQYNWIPTSELKPYLQRACLINQYRFDRKSFLFLLMCLKNCEKGYHIDYKIRKMQEQIKNCPNSDRYLLRYSTIMAIFTNIKENFLADKKTQIKALKYLSRIQKEIFEKC